MKPKGEKGNCIFCGATTHLDRSGGEHIYPKWMLELLGAEGGQAYRRVVGPGFKQDPPLRIGFTVPRAESFQTKDFRVRKGLKAVTPRVCTDCNTGWMSRLESQAKPIFEKLVPGFVLTGLTTDTEREVLAHWMFKTACVVAHEERGPWIIPPSIANLAMSKRFPPGMCLFGTHCDNAQLRGHVSADWFATTNDAQPFARLLGSSFKFSFALGHVILLLAYWPGPPPWRFAVWERVHKKALWHKDCAFTGAPWTRQFDRRSPVPGLEFGATLGVSYGEWDPQNASHEGTAKRLLEGWANAERCHPLTPWDLCACESGQTFGACHGRRV